MDGFVRRWNSPVCQTRTVYSEAALACIMHPCRMSPGFPRAEIDSSNSRRVARFSRYLSRRPCHAHEPHRNHVPPCQTRDSTLEQPFNHRAKSPVQSRSLLPTSSKIFLLRNSKSRHFTRASFQNVQHFSIRRPHFSPEQCPRRLIHSLRSRESDS